MAVYTHVTTEAIAEHLQAYDVGTLELAMGIAEGVENSNYLIETLKDGVPHKFILTLYEKRVAKEDLPFFIGLMQHLAAKGFPCPQPIATRDGTIISELAGRPAALISFLHGRSYSMIRPAYVKALGTAAGEMHLASADFDQTRPNNLSISGWQAIYDKLGKQLDRVQPGLFNLIGESLWEIKEEWPRDLPAGIIHADMFPDNVFFDGDQLTGVIDYYFACYDMFAYELAICLNCWCFEPGGEFNMTKAQRFLRAYDAVRPLRPEEREALPILARGAALRFLLTRAHDKIFHPEGAMVTPKDPLEYLRKLQFHLHVRSVGEYGL
jgi:homoserine kinase type II